MQKRVVPAIFLFLLLTAFLGTVGVRAEHPSYPQNWGLSTYASGTISFLDATSSVKLVMNVAATGDLIFYAYINASFIENSTIRVYFSQHDYNSLHPFYYGLGDGELDVSTISVTSDGTTFGDTSTADATNQTFDISAGDFSGDKVTLWFGIHDAYTSNVDSWLELHKIDVIRGGNVVYELVFSSLNDTTVSGSIIDYTLDLRSTTISISSSIPQTASCGDSLVVEGSLVDETNNSLSGQTIQIELLDSNNTLLSDSTVTLADGSFSKTITIPQMSSLLSTITLKVSFEGWTDEANSIVYNSTEYTKSIVVGCEAASSSNNSSSNSNDYVAQLLQLWSYIEGSGDYLSGYIPLPPQILTLIVVIIVAGFVISLLAKAWKWLLVALFVAFLGFLGVI